MRRLLILSCSAMKRPDAGLIPACERYNSPFYQVLRAYLRAHPQVALSRDLELLILSARYGLIDGRAAIAAYDQRMDRRRAEELRQAVERDLGVYLTRQPEAILVQAGRFYRLALPDLPDRAVWTEGGIGVQLRQAKCWLRGEADSGWPGAGPTGPGPGGRRGAG